MKASHYASKPARLAALMVMAAVLAGCAARKHPAPVEDRPVAARSAEPVRPAAPPASARQTAVAPSTPTPLPATSSTSPPAVEAAGATPRPGFYTVRPGDTLGRIALDHGQSWRDLARWNGLDNPNLIEVGQQLMVVPPAVDASTATAVSRPVSPPGRVEPRSTDGRAAAGPAAAGAGPAGTAPSGAAGSAPGTGGAAPAPAAPPAPAVAAREVDEEVAWAWPATGPVLATFDEARQAKGLAIGGKAGDPVLAAADGRVVYAGSGLRGYGNLVIVKHNATFLSAYAHNQALLVKEDQVVRRGQKIAEMGSSEAERVQLHFEIRRLGRPVDPSRLLPAR